MISATLLESYEGSFTRQSSQWQAIGKNTVWIKDKQKFRIRKIEENLKIIEQRTLYCHGLNESKDISRQDFDIAIGLKAVLQIEKPVYRYSAQSEIYNSINKLQKITSCLTMQQHTYTLKVGMHLAKDLKEFVKINNLLI